MATENISIFLSTGGTGGHVFPANELAKALQEKGYQVQMLSDFRGTAYIDKTLNVPVHVLSLGHQGGVWGKLQQVFHVLREAYNCFTLFRKISRPHLVVAFGGYMSAPPLLAARILGIPYVLHEQNAILGRVNRLMVSGAKAMALGLPPASEKKIKSAIPQVITGNPVRQEIKELLGKEEPKKDLAPYRLFVFGGSQGSLVLTKATLNCLKTLGIEEQQKLSLVMQVPTGHEAYVREQLSHTRVHIEKIASFFEDLPKQLKITDLIICRSGAMTVSEVPFAGNPTLFVPLKIAMDNHQYHNAKALVEKGAAWMLTEEQLADQTLHSILREMMEDKKLPASQSRWGKILGFCSPEATTNLRKLCEDILEDKRRSTSYKERI